MLSFEGDFLFQLREDFQSRILTMAVPVLQGKKLLLRG